jgi:hypothetical protein
MKPGSKTRTRQTLGGGTKIVTRTKSSTGAKTRTVERSKGNPQTGMETKRKVRRVDQGGVRKTVSKSFERGSSNRTDNNSTFSKLVKNEKSTLVKKDTFRKKGSLKSKPLGGSNTITSSSRKANTIGMTLAAPSDFGESMYVSRSGKERGFRKRPEIYIKDVIKKGSKKPQSTKFENKKEAKKEYSSQKENMSKRVSMTSAEKRHIMATQLSHPSSFDRKRTDPSSSEVETGRTYTPKRK